jgi:hypothetical protein
MSVTPRPSAFAQAGLPCRAAEGWPLPEQAVSASVPANAPATNAGPALARADFLVMVSTIPPGVPEF